MFLSTLFVIALTLVDKIQNTRALSSVKVSPHSSQLQPSLTAPRDRKEFLTTAAALIAVAAPAMAAPEILNTPKGAKYAILQQAKEKARPADGDIVAIEYTGYLSDGTIFGM